MDDFSKYTWLFPLKVKYDVYFTFIVFITYVETSIGNKIKCLRSDYRGGFSSTLFTFFLKSNGISHQLSCPHTPKQNGCPERKHRHLVETTRTLLVSYHVPHVYGVKAFSTATYLINRLPISRLTTSPWKLLFKTFLDYSKLKTFGCNCFPWLKPYVSSKLDGKSKCCVFLGYILQYKGYRCLDHVTHRVYISRHVKFDEFTYLFHTSIAPIEAASSFTPYNATPFDMHFSMTNPRMLTTKLSSSPSTIVPSSVQSYEHSLVQSQVQSQMQSPMQSQVHSPVQSQVQYSTHLMVTRSKAGIFKPKAYFPTKHPLPDSIDYVPTTYLQAAKYEHWRLVMQEEFNALQLTCTWSLVPYYSSQNVLGVNGYFESQESMMAQWIDINLFSS